MMLRHAAEEIMTRLRASSCILFSLLVATAVSAQSTPRFGPEVQKYIKYDSPRIVLTHVRVIDGTGTPAQDDRNIVIENGRITAIQPGKDISAAGGETVLNLRGYTVFPGIVGMHNHLYHIARPNLHADGSSDQPLMVPEMLFSSPLLYLANGVTTMRTTGSVEPYADINEKQMIEDGKLAGPHMDVTAPYLEGSHSYFIQMHFLKDADDARRTVDYWADEGATSFKAYMNITRAELKAAIDEAHKRGLKITGHLCSVTSPEAADMGIDDLEHGFFVNTQLDPGKKEDECSEDQGMATLMAMDPKGEAAKDLIARLVEKKVAVTSTLPVFEHMVPGRPPLQQRVLDAMTPQARERFLLARNLRASRPPEKAAAAFRRDMDLERAFVAAGGLLLAGPDPTGNGGTLPGFADQREIELLVEAGFTPVEAIKIATWNGAVYLGRQDRIGSVAAGKDADLVVVKGDPATKIDDIENVDVVFKDGVGYDPVKLLNAVRGHYGEY
jgi:imidazolonepropionase-like amidohydrolase